jgi:anti-sigma-K factor RskA
MSGRCDFGGDAAAYALGALEPSEVEAFREHLEECAVCREEVEALGGTAQALAMAAPQHPVSRRLRRRVLRAVRDEPRSQPMARRRWRPVVAWSKHRGALAAAAAAAVVALAVVAGVELSGPGGNAGAKVIHAQVTGISGRAELRIVGGRAELIVQHLAPPPPGHVYQVWLKPPHAPPVSASVLFSVDSDGSADVGLPADLRGISQVMVTPEPTGGSVVPTHAPVIVAPLT